MTATTQKRSKTTIVSLYRENHAQKLRRNKYLSSRVYAAGEPRKAGRFIRVALMIETTDFFQDQIKQCNALAARASNKTDREFWLSLAHRWEGLFRSERAGGVETLQKLRFERPIFAKRRRAA
jgi:hypothetical protein